VNIAKLSISIAFVAGLTAQPRSLHAQVVDAPNIAGGENMAWNKGVPQATREAARAVFLEGNRLFKIPLFSQAVEKYTEALDKWKHPAFYFNLAIAEINLSQYLEAREHLERAMQYGPEPLRADRFQEARNQLVEVQRHLGRIHVACPTQDAEITLDGATLFTGPGEREVWVAPRAHEVAAKKSDYGTLAKRVNVAAGARETISLSPRKLVEDRPWATWKPWAVFGAGVAIVGASGVVHALSARGFSNYDAGFVTLDCAATGCTEAQIDQKNPKLGPQLHRARLQQEIAVGGYLVGAAVIATGVALVVHNRPHLLEREDANPGRVAVAPLVSPDMLGVVVTVSH
jgi:hypothetical protein